MIDKMVVWFPAEEADAGGRNPAVNKLIAAWAGKWPPKSTKVGGFGLLSVTIAA